MSDTSCVRCVDYGTDAQDLSPCTKCEENGYNLYRPVEDIVKQPNHYARLKIEPITFVMENDLPFHVGNIIKYACRAGHKLYEGKDAVESEIIDLEKVRRYAEMRISLLRGEGVLGNGPEPRRCL